MTAASELLSGVWLIFRQLESAIGRIPRVWAGATEPSNSPKPVKGRVTLTGAGPGDGELVTIKAVKALQAADVVIFDALVTEDVLAWANPAAELIFVGKRGGCTSWRQSDINRLMTEHARAGKQVVRLKGGDPSVFGRSGEETAYLRQRGIDVEIVPGITAASAMAANLQISLTHRDRAQTVRFVTGHSKDGGLPKELDWRAIADPASTTIFYMGARHAEEIVAKALEHGLGVDTPACVAASVSRADQRYEICTLATLASAVRRFPVSMPILVGLGGVFEAHLVTSPVIERTWCKLAVRGNTSVEWLVGNFQDRCLMSHLECIGREEMDTWRG